MKTTYFQELERLISGVVPDQPMKYESVDDIKDHIVSISESYETDEYRADFKKALWNIEHGNDANRLKI